jgi:hypothetical protein
MQLVAVAVELSTLSLAILEELLALMWVVTWISSVMPLKGSSAQ